MADPIPIDRTRRVDRVSHLQWVPIADMTVSPVSQREFKQAHAEEFAANFDLEGFGFPVVNKRDGKWYLVDGQHRVAALRIIGWGDQQIQCEAYDGLSEAEEAELFLKRNRRRNVNAFDTFRVAINAGRLVESDIERIVRAQGLKVSKDHSDGSISAVGALRRAYALDDRGVALGRALHFLREAFGTAGDVFRTELIVGSAYVCLRYDGQVDLDALAERVGRVPGGVLGLRNKANMNRRTFGKPLPDCVAAAIVDTYNAGKGGKKLELWWR